MFGRIFSPDNWFFRSTGKLVDIVLLSLLWLVMSLPLVTVGPASAALYDTVVKTLRNQEENTPYKRFFRVFRREFKVGAITSLVLLAAGFGLYCLYLLLFLAATEAAQVMLIDCLRITHPCGSQCPFHQQMILNLLRIVAAKNLVFHQKIEVTSKRTTREKLMTYLTLQAKGQGSLEFDIPYDRQELADYLEVDRSGLSAEIGKLRRQGVIEADRSRFKLCGPFAP